MIPPKPVINRANIIPFKKVAENNTWVAAWLFHVISLYWRKKWPYNTWVAAWLFHYISKVFHHISKVWFPCNFPPPTNQKLTLQQTHHNTQPLSGSPWLVLSLGILPLPWSQSDVEYVKHLRGRWWFQNRQIGSSSPGIGLKINHIWVAITYRKKWNTAAFFHLACC